MSFPAAYKIAYPILIMAITCLTIASCMSGNAKTDSGSAITHQSNGDTIFIPPGSSVLTKIMTDSVHAALYRSRIMATGTVKAIPTQFAEIAVPFSGRITRSWLHLGMHVTTRTPLFELNSPDFMNAQKLFFQEKEQMLLAERKMKRQQDLVANGVGTAKELEEAKANYDVERKEYENAVLGIRLFKADPDKLVLGQPLVVYSPIAGEVVDNKIVVGQFIKNDAGSIATVAELSKVWIAGQIKEKDLAALQSFRECSITIAGFPGKQFTGKLFHVGAMIDENTRSAQMMIECVNRDHIFKPGMYVNVEFINAPVQAIVVPQSAVQQLRNTEYVYKLIRPRTYIRQPIETRGVLDNKTFVLKGLQERDVIIRDGAYLLNQSR